METSTEPKGTDYSIATPEPENVFVIEIQHPNRGKFYCGRGDGLAVYTHEEIAHTFMAVCMEEYEYSLVPYKWKELIIFRANDIFKKAVVNFTGEKGYYQIFDLPCSVVSP